MPAPSPRRRLTAFAVALAVLIATPLAVVATDRFADVPDNNPHHNDITWLADAAVTLGCNPPANTNYCPDQPVRRDQMASFLRRLAENRVVDAATVEGHSAAQLMPATESATFDGIQGLGTDLGTVGQVTIDVPTSGTVLAFGNGVFISFGQETVGILGVSTSPTDIGINQSAGFLDGTGTERLRLPVSVVGSFEVAPGSHTFYLNAQKSSTFDADDLNIGEPSLTVLFVPGG